MYATLHHGSPVMVDYTPGSAVTAGDVIVAGGSVRIAHRDIAANVLGALAAAFGVYKVPKAITGGSAIADGVKVYWNASAHQITATQAGNAVFGITIGASVDADTTQYVLHMPEAVVYSAS